ncbi:MAG TPA: IS5/IS1182 family transposase, partial [Lactobacillus sp.]|nr:IS5/IS1182 family transposase [Lactobacillus sp.]
AESLAVKIDAAIVLSNVLTLLRVFAIPILILAKFEGEAYQIRYKFTTRVEDMVA